MATRGRRTSDEQAAIDPAARAVVRRLLEEKGQAVSAETRRAIVALGPAAVAPLVEMMEDEDLAMDDAPGAGMGQVWAVRMLCELKAAAAVEPMLRLMVATGSMDYLHDELVVRLPKLGAAVVEPALRGRAASDDEDARGDFAAVLAACGVRDPRILAVLIEEVRATPTSAAMLAEYGDPAALPFLSEVLDRYEVKGPPRLLGDQGLTELTVSIKELGGTLTAAQQRKLDRGTASVEASRAQLKAALARRGRGGGAAAAAAPRVAPARRAVRPGPNEPCWCGSAKKYKTCHRQADERGG